MPLGWFCQQEGLAEDKSLWIRPDPDPIHDAVGNAPDVIAAALAEDLAQHAHDEADKRWKEALSALATARLQASSGATFMPGTGHSRRQVKGRERLVEAEAEARAERDRLGDELVKCRICHQDAIRTARHLQTTARLEGQRGT